MYTSLDFEACSKFESFSYWFVPTSLNKYQVFRDDLSGAFSDIVGYFDESTLEFTPKSENTSDVYSSDVYKDFIQFKMRPEYKIGKPVEIKDGETNATTYETLIVGLYLSKYFILHKCNPDSKISFIQRGLDWLRTTDFYSAPGSTIYHDAYVGGLLDHTLRVVNQIIDVSQLSKFTKCSIVSAILVACVHDWCKIGLYTSYTRNVKNEQGQWEQVDAFKRQPAAIPLGHGVESLYKASKIFNLSEAESVAIRWHMGSWNVCDPEMNDLQSANERYPLVHMLQFADQLSIVEY